MSAVRMAPAPSDARWTFDVLPTVAPATRAASPVATLFLLLAPGLEVAGARVWGALVAAFRHAVLRRRCAARIRASAPHLRSVYDADSPRVAIRVAQHHVA